MLVSARILDISGSLLRMPSASGIVTRHILAPSQALNRQMALCSCGRGRQAVYVVPDAG